ncbi:MAG TPA: hypothetical protein VHR66_07000 [Gemmataceae bacterium]|jgi:hypothetical protein|nr:hypothetical protein [Gemmataceae bacterium]
MRTLLAFFVSTVPLTAADKPPVYVWLEAEWFSGVSGSYAYWPDTTKPAKPTGHWGIAGPGISAEWSQGGESEWNSIGASPAETKAECHRDFVVPRAGKYRVWVRYVDHRKKTEPFTVGIQQGAQSPLAAEMGVKPVVPVNDEYQLYWGFSFGWGSANCDLLAGKARVSLTIDKVGEGWRQVDCILITDDLNYVPVGREKPPFAYLSAFGEHPADGAAWRGSAKDLKVGASWKRPQLASREFSMWIGGLDADAKWWEKQDLAKLTREELLFEIGPPRDIKDQFHKQFTGQKDTPVLYWPGLVVGSYLGSTPDLSPGKPMRVWLERTKAPFYILTNYASGAYTDKSGPATYQALTGPLAEQFLGYIHGEALGTGGVGHGDKALGPTRREHIDALGKRLLKSQAEDWSKIYKTPVSEAHMAKSISCLSCESISLAHLFHEIGAKVVGYEEDATNIHIPMRIAFERGAARQYGDAWINYASGNFGDACNYFTQEPIVPRGAKSWFHSKYAITDGVTTAWYRKMYYLNYLGGASAIYWEQSLTNQWILPGPGTHPIQLSPYGRATEDFQAFVDRLPDRGEPYTPIGVLLNYGHGYERVNNYAKMLTYFEEAPADRELRELFNVFWHPTAIVEGQPVMPDVQSMPNGKYGNIFDVLVDRAAKAKAIFEYPVIWAAGDVDLSGPWPGLLEDYVKRGGTLVVNSEAARGKLPERLLGFKLSGSFDPATRWSTDDGPMILTTPYDVERGEMAGAKALAWASPKIPLITRHQVGEGSVILTLCPRMIGMDERAHPALPYLMNGLTHNLLPIEVRRADGKEVNGEIMYQVNKTKDGWLVGLVNNRGLDKTQNGIARVDRRAFVDLVVRTKLNVSAAKEYTEPRDLTVEKGANGAEVRVRVHPGDVQVVYLSVK